MMISCEATMLASRLAVLLSAFYHRVNIAHEVSSFHCDAGDLQSVLVGGFMKFDIKEFIDDKYAKAINILKENLKENYHIFYGVRLSEILFPASEYGTDAFYQEFEAINSVVLPLVIYDLNEKKPIMVIGFELKNGKTMLESSDVTVLEIESLSDILTNNVLSVLFVE